MIRATPECSDRSREERASKGFEVTKRFRLMTLGVLGGSYKSWIENQVRLRAQLLKYKCFIYK